MLTDGLGQQVAPQPLIVDGPEQANCLRQGLSMPGVEALQDPAKLNYILERVEAGHVSEVVVPVSLHDTAKGLALLVMTAELEHTRGLLNSGLVSTLSVRIGSEAGIAAKFALLEPFLGKSS